MSMVRWSVRARSIAANRRSHQGPTALQVVARQDERSVRNREGWNEMGSRGRQGNRGWVLGLGGGSWGTEDRMIAERKSEMHGMAAMALP